MKIPKNDSLLPLARQLRREMTPHERKLWFLFLRTYPVKIYKQRIIRSYIADFYCASAKLVIELDGAQHFEADAAACDAKRDAAFRALGLCVLRFSNREIDREFPLVCERIDQVIKERMPENG